jgi:hypothetical protein
VISLVNGKIVRQSFWVEWFLDPFPPVNELILGWVFRMNSLSKYVVNVNESYM